MSPSLQEALRRVLDSLARLVNAGAQLLEDEHVGAPAAASARPGVVS